MGYQVYEDRDADRWAGYGVPAECDWPGCTKGIDRGLGYKCEEHVTYFEHSDGREVEVNDGGCGLYFCEAHRYETAEHDGITPKPDSAEWVAWMLSDESWRQWRLENPERVRELRKGHAA